MNNFYTIGDFENVLKVDAHAHICSSGVKFMDFAQKLNMKFFSINTDVPYHPYPTLKKQQDLVLFHKKRNREQINYATSFSLNGIEQKGWADRVIEHLKLDFKCGAIALKVWKNIGMDDKYSNGRFIMLDDEVFDPIFSFLFENNIPVLGHIGEPKNCWLAIEEMTVNNDREYFSQHPEYHMYNKPEFPSYQQIIDSRDSVLEKYPELIYIGCHLGSQEWSIDEIGKRFDKSPNYFVDTAERICHVQYQSQQDYDKVRNFFIKYQDRIIYGSDVELFDEDNEDTLIVEMQERWLADWQYFVTDDVMSVPEVTGEFRGLKLPKEVIDKIFYLNHLRCVLGA